MTLFYMIIPWKALNWPVCQDFCCHFYPGFGYNYFLPLRKVWISFDIFYVKPPRPQQHLALLPFFAQTIFYSLVKLVPSQKCPRIKRFSTFTSSQKPQNEKYFLRFGGCHREIASPSHLDLHFLSSTGSVAVALQGAAWRGRKRPGICGILA